MKPTHLLLLGFLMLALSGMAQTQSVTSIHPPTSTKIEIPEDAADVPYWIDMMQDPEANFFTAREAFNAYWNDRPITRGCGWKVFKRWEYWMQSRIEADGSLPDPGKTYQEYTEYQKNNRSASGDWVNLGPSLIPLPGPAGYEGLGRLNNIAFHPTDLDIWYVGAPSGGLWMTTDGGNTWETHTDTLPTLGVSSIIINHNNPDIIFIGSGDRDAGDAPGLGVFKSTDGGLTWTESSTGMGNKTVGEMLQHPTNHQILLAATNGGIFRSTDLGNNWSLTQVGNFKDIDFKPNDPNIVYAAAGADFYRSADNGVTWTQITSGLTGGQRGTIDVTPANPDYVYFVPSNSGSGFKGLYRSTDAGLTFSTRSTTPNILDWSCDGSGTGGQGWYDLSLAVDPGNPEIIFVGGVNIWRSTNGGTTWSIVGHWYGGCSVAEVHADIHMLKFSPYDGNLYTCNDGGIYHSGDGGTTWIDHTETMTIGQIYKLGQAQTVREKVINGFQDNGTYTYALPSWLATGGGDGMECAFDYEDASWSYHTIYYGQTYRKYNNSAEVKIAGENVNGITESGAWVTPFALSVTDPGTMFIGFKNIWRSDNIKESNITWDKISDFGTGNNCAVIKQSSADPDIFYVSRYDNRFFRSDDITDIYPTWTEITSFLPASGYPTDVETHPDDPETVYITIDHKVFKSTNKGLTWTDISGTLPDIATNTIVYYDYAPEGLYLGTDAGVFYRDATMSDWISFNEGLPVNVEVTELEIYYDNDSVSMDALRASTYGRGLWSSDLYHETPDADFTADETQIPAGCGISFTDLSTGIPTEWSWTFEGGTPAVSSEKNPQDIVYLTPGTYLVKLIASNEEGTDSITKTGYITVSNSILPEADFSASAQVVCSNELIQFTDESAHCPTSWEWSFNPSNVVFMQGTSANSQDPAVIFTQNGTYDVTLTATNSNGSSTETKTSYIMNGGYAVPFEANFEDGFETQHWTIDNPDLLTTWDTISVPGMTSGDKAVWMNFYDYVYMYKRDRLISPTLDCSNAVTLWLTFKHAYAQRYTLKDSLIILVSDDCGETFERIWAMGPDGTPDVFVTHEPMEDPFFPESTNDWCGGSYGVSCYTVDLMPYIGKSNIKIAFESYNRMGNNLFLDDIVIDGHVSVPETVGQTSAIHIYPNPTAGKVFITVDRLSGEAGLKLFDIRGSEIMNQAIQKPCASGNPEKVTAQLDMSHLPPGIYLLQVITGQESLVKRIIKK